jgi:hypothetical protein
MDYIYQLQVVFNMTNMKRIQLFTILSSLLVLSSCDEITNPYPNVLDDGSTIIYDEGIDLDSLGLEQLVWEKHPGAPTTQRNLLIEEFTGIACTACPDGSRILVNLDTIYGDQVIPVSIHAGKFALPNPDTTKIYGIDLRTLPEGEIIKNAFNPDDAYPKGIVSRLTNLAEGKDKWRITIDNHKNDPQTAIIDLDVWYAPNEEYIRVILDYEYLFNSSDVYDLQVYIIEDHIIGWQLDNGVVKSDYDHKYVMRRAINGAWGATALPAVNGELYHKEYVIKKNGRWVKDNLKVAVYLANRQTREIIQAHQVKLK